MFDREAVDMGSTTIFNTSSTTTYTEYPTTTEAAEKFDLSDYLLKNYIIIIIPSVFVCIFLIILFIILINKILKKRRFDPKQLETYSSVNYDDETIEEELGGAEDFVYTSCKLLVGGEYEDTSDMTNSEPEYDTMSVDVSVNANQSPIVDWNQSTTSQGETADVARSLKTLPPSFWKR